MRGKRTTPRSAAKERPSEDRWSAFDALTDADIKQAIEQDKDAAPALSPAWLKKATLVRPPGKEMISIRLDKDVLDYFRSKERWQTRINGLLRMIMDHEKDSVDH